VRATAWSRALVTGASSGIGRAFAVELAARGTDLVVVARRRNRLEDLAAEVVTAHPGRSVEVLPADLADRGQLGAVEARLADPSLPPVDLLVNNAGFGTHGRFATLPVEREEEEILVNLLAPVRLTRAALPPMLAARHGAVVNVSSLTAVQPLPLWATYASTKAYLVRFSKAVDAEVRGQGVRVLVVMPGFTRTEFGYPEEVRRSVVPGPLWMSAEAVARAALDDLDRGRTESVPGAGYRAFGAVARLAPWPLARLVIRVATRRMW
jgi:short-subunit dehydrogenase